MIGDKILPKPHHKRAAGLIFALLAETKADKKRLAITIAGESGSGKSEIAAELAACFEKDGRPTVIFQQDDYFFYPPKTNHQMRVKDIKHVGLTEVNLQLLNAHLEAFKLAPQKLIEKPLVVFEKDTVTRETVNPADYSVLIAEGTYTTVLSSADVRVFIDRTYEQTKEQRLERGRDRIDEFSEKVLLIEHNIISKHKKLATIIVDSAFEVSAA
jgi:uridine kinase